MEGDYPGKLHLYEVRRYSSGSAAQARHARRGPTRVVAQTPAAFSAAGLRRPQKRVKGIFAPRQKQCYDCWLS